MTGDYFVFQGVKSTDKNIYLLEYEPVLLPSNQRRFIDIPGRSGSVAVGSSAGEDVVIRCKLAMQAREGFELINDLSYASAWLSGRGELRFWDMLDKYYVGEVINETLVENKGSWGEFEVEFRCEPVKYGERKTMNIKKGPPVYNLGTYKTTGTITIEITEKVDHIKVTLLTSGEFIYLGHNFIPGDIVKIDLEKEKAYKNGHSIMQDCYLESDFFEIPTGRFEISLSSGKGTLEYVERWL